MHMVYNMLPAGRTVTYTTPEIDDIPNIPVVTSLDVESAITKSTDAIVEVRAGRERPGTAAGTVRTHGSPLFSSAMDIIRRTRQSTSQF